MERAIARMSQSICDLLEGSMQALYLYGSVTMDDFQPGWSDIDLVCFAGSALAEEQAQKLLTLRQQLLQQERETPITAALRGSSFRWRNFCPAILPGWSTGAPAVSGFYPAVPSTPLPGTSC